jgi:hypothetical protein
MVKMKMLALAAALVVPTLVAAPAFAMGDLPPLDPHGPITRAPEIDAGSGLAAMAVVFAALCLAWERRRTA